MPVIRRTFAVGLLGCNCSVLAAQGSKRAIVIDPGGEPERIVSTLRRLDLELSEIVITHGHVDHVLAAGELKRMTGATISLHPDDRFLWDDLAWQGRWIGLDLSNDLPAPDRDLVDGDRIENGGLTLEVLHTPGHTPGSLSFLIAGEPLVFAGDTLFRRSIGRTDLPGGDGNRIEASIRDRLYTLPEETVVVCGHGPETTIGEEAEQNPFVAGR